jgi:hypothetical protein
LLKTFCSSAQRSGQRFPWSKAVPGSVGAASVVILRRAMRIDVLREMRLLFIMRMSPERRSGNVVLEILTGGPMFDKIDIGGCTSSAAQRL